MKTEYGLEKHLIAPAQVFDVDSRDSAIGNSQERSFFGAHTSGAQADILDRSGAVAELAKIAHANDFIAQYRNSAKQIFDGLLCAKADRQGPDAHARQRGGQVETQHS